MICHFLLLEAPIRSCKQFENSLASVKSMIQFTTPAKRSFPSDSERSPPFTARQRNFPWQVQQPGEVASPQKLNSPTSVIAKEELYHRKDRCCSFKSDPWSVVHLGKANRPRPNTKLLLSAIVKASPTVNLKIKQLYENENLKMTKPPAEHQGHLFYPSKSFSALQNLVRLSL